MVCLLGLCLLLAILLVGPMQQHHPSSRDRGGGHTFTASATSKSSLPSKTDGNPGNVHYSCETEQHESQRSGSFACFDVNGGSRGVWGSTDAGLLENFSWDALARPPGSASELTTLENECKEHHQNLMKAGRKRSHYDTEDDKETSSAKCYQCRFCDMKFQKSQALGGHMNRHKQERQNESWNKAYQLIQQANPSPILPGNNQVSRFGAYHMLASQIPFEFGTARSAPHMGKAYGAGRSHFTESTGFPYDGKQYVGPNSHTFTMPTDIHRHRNAEYLTSGSLPLLAMGASQIGPDAWNSQSTRPDIHLTYMNQPPVLISRLPAQGPFIRSETASSVSPLESSLLDLNTARVAPQAGGSGRYLNQDLSLVAPRTASQNSMQTTPQNSMQQYMDMPLLPQTRNSEQLLSPYDSVQPLLSNTQAAQRGPAYVHSEGESSFGVAGHGTCLSHISALDIPQEFHLRPYATCPSATRTAAFDSALQEERTLIGGLSLAMGSGNDSSQTGPATAARKPTNSGSAEYEGVWNDFNLN